MAQNPLFLLTLSEQLQLKSPIRFHTLQEGDSEALYTQKTCFFFLLTWDFAP